MRHPLVGLDSPDILHAIQDDGALHMSHGAGELAAKAARAKQTMEEDLGREATDAEVAESLGVSEKRLTSIQRARRTVSLDAPLYPGRADKAGNADKTPLGDLIEDSNTPAPDELADFAWLRDKVASMLHTARSEGLLTDQDYYVLSLRFGLADRDPRTLEEVGAAMDRTRARAGQLVNEALHKLRASGLCEGLREYACNS